MAGKSPGLTGRIDSRKAALQMVKDCGNAFYVVAALNAVIAMVLTLVAVDDLSRLGDAAVYGLLGYFIREQRSRIAACLAVVFASLVVGITAANLLGFGTGTGGFNILLAVIVMLAAVRSVEATFKLQGRFSKAGSKADTGPAKSKRRLVAPLPEVVE